ncbi:hypothetical protein AN216_12265 [Streptomyces oceani]|uniref:Uncharacterized protein n=1 Tax=Streptomyces oceani TaxID=1075402 RepID=A0A1E7KHF1_9ACTN|nr:hypothetical protein AN216_12265 [Streptomyces oceani]
MALAGLLLSGCGGGSDDGGDDKKDSSSDQGQQQDQGQEETQNVDPADLKGSWATEGNAKILAFNQGGVGLSGQDVGTTCAGKVGSGQPISFSLKCQDGGAEFSKGEVRSLEGDKLTVAWGNGETESFTRGPADMPSVPEDLPTSPEDLPSADVPTDAAELP